MPRLKWNNPGDNVYETGIDRGVLYVPNSDGVPWNGLKAVVERPSGGSARAYYFDGVKYANISSAEEFEATIGAFTYPDEFMLCDGTARVHSGLYATQQPRKSFGLSYRTKIGNDLTDQYGYKIHLIYNALAAPSERNSNTLGGSVETTDFSWDITTRPPAMTGYRRTAHLIVDTRSSNPQAVSDVEDILYGTEEDPPRLPTLAELITVFDAYAILSVTDNGDGTFTVDGPDEAITMLSADVFEITWPSAVPIDAETYNISSL